MFSNLFEGLTAPEYNRVFVEKSEFGLPWPTAKLLDSLLCMNVNYN
jgi:hypothetical protein